MIMSKLACPEISCGVFDSLSAFFASRFSNYLFFSGLSISASQYFEVDSGLHSIERLLSLKRRVSSVPNLKPVIADIDDSFGDYSLSGSHARSLKQAGFYGAILEDQARPRKCGHKSGKVLNPLHKYIDALKRFKESEADLFLVARTDAETPEDIDTRVSALADLASSGYIDAVQVDGISTLGEIKVIKEALPPSVMFVANHVEGGKLRDSSLSDLSAAGADILTLSTYMLSCYLSKLSICTPDLLSLPTGNFTLAELDCILSGT